MLFFSNGHTKESELSAYLDGALRQSARLRMESHVADCPSCRTTLDELRELKATLSALPPEPAPRSFAVRQADVAPAPKMRRAPSQAVPSLLGGLAMVALVTFVTLVAIDVSDPGGSGVGQGGPASTRNMEAMVPAADGAGDMTIEAATDTLNQEDGVQEPQTEPAEAFDESAQSDDGGSDVAIRLAEAGMAALALLAAGALVWWRVSSG